MEVLKFNQYITEKLGLSDNVIQQGEKFFEIINKDKGKFIFDVEYDIEGKKYPMKIKIDTKFKMGGQFQPEEKPPTIVVRDRSSLSIVTHELKHADRFFRMGMKAYEEDYTTLFGISDFKKSLSLFPQKFRNIFFLFYFLQKEEFEAQFHSDFLYFKEQVAKIKLSDDIKERKVQIMNLWREDSKNSMAWKIYSGTLPVGKVIGGSLGNIEMKVPKEQKPFKFENWCDSKVIDSIILLFLQSKRNLQIEDSTVFKILKAFVPEQVMSMFNQGVPKKYQPMVQEYKAKLERLMNKTMDSYYKKYLRIPYHFIQG